MMRVMVDSGAYSAWTRGIQFDLHNYIEYIKRNEHLIDSYIVLDVIPGSHGQQEWRSDQIEICCGTIVPKLKVIKQAGLTPMPVVRAGESIDWLKRYFDDGEHRLQFRSRAHFAAWIAFPICSRCFVIILTSRCTGCRQRRRRYCTLRDGTLTAPTLRLG